ncbi:MAG: malto-oligosyltrehalose synthase [Verrucomicrobiota bacterium]
MEKLTQGSPASELQLHRPQAGAALPPKRVPSTTYRIQFSRDFGFEQARRLLDYLDELGITDFYAAPWFHARPGSCHGYDLCDFNRLNPELGTLIEFEKFMARLQELGMGLLLDFVPNHMAAHWENSWWRDLLENGPDSEFASFFDIDWIGAPDEPSGPKIVLPILEDHYGRVLEDGKIQIRCEMGRIQVHYAEHRFPAAPRSMPLLIALVLESLPRSADSEAVRCALSQFGSGSITGLTASDQSALHERMTALLAGSPVFREALDSALNKLNGRPGDAQSFDALDRFIQAQHYQLHFWRTGLSKVKYRRFFDVSDLVALRMENPAVFDRAHHQLFQWVQQGKVTGLRIDHPDGLLTPKSYFAQLQQRTPGLFVVAEKILSAGESLPSDWAVHGTTGYDFLNAVNGWFIQKENETFFSAMYREFTGVAQSYAEIACRAREFVLRELFSREWAVLSREAERIAQDTRHYRDLAGEALHEALGCLLSAFPVYRTYYEPEASWKDADRAWIDQALQAARGHRPGLDPLAFDFFDWLLMRRWPETWERKSQWDDWILRFQQLTAPLSAKGLEDTAFYRFHRFCSLNEVGGHPPRFGSSTSELHQFNLRQQQNWPHSLLTTSTHDTKRGEDVRARLNVLSEIPEEWRQAVEHWRECNAVHKTVVHGAPMPEANLEYLLYQTLVGSWPHSEMPDQRYRDRVIEYMLKAAREAKEHTSWINPDAAYENAVTRFVSAVLSANGSSTFMRSFLALQKKAAWFGSWNSISQVLLKITSPGVPDFYQGAEWLDLNLVDPDNRRPIDFEARQQSLANLKRNFNHPERRRETVQALLRSPGDALKLFVTWRALDCRKRHRALFERGAYEVIDIDGAGKDFLMAFARWEKDEVVVTLARRFYCTQFRGEAVVPIGTEIWGETHWQIPPPWFGQKWRNCFTGREFVLPGPTASVREILSDFPIALLELQPLAD